MGQCGVLDGIGMFPDWQVFRSTLFRSSYREGHWSGMAENVSMLSLQRKNESDCEVLRVAQRTEVDGCFSDSDRNHVQCAHDLVSLNTASDIASKGADVFLYILTLVANENDRDLNLSISGPRFSATLLLEPSIAWLLQCDKRWGNHG